MYATLHALDQYGVINYHAHNVTITFLKFCSTVAGNISRCKEHCQITNFHSMPDSLAIHSAEIRLVINDVYLCSAQTMQVEQFEEEVEGQLTSLSDLAKLCNQDKIKKVIACGMDYIS